MPYGVGFFVGEMNNEKLLKLTALIEQENTDRFYHWTEWRTLREQVLKLDNYECQMCKEKGRYSRAAIVHHIKHLKDRPDLALSIYDSNTGERQLISVCKECHEKEHPESQRQYVPKAEPITRERWD